MALSLGFGGSKKKYQETTDTTGFGSRDATGSFTRDVTAPGYWQQGYQGMMGQYLPASGAGQAPLSNPVPGVAPQAVRPPPPAPPPPQQFGGFNAFLPADFSSLGTSGGFGAAIPAQQPPPQPGLVSFGPGAGVQQPAAQPAPTGQLSGDVTEGGLRAAPGAPPMAQGGQPRGQDTYATAIPQPVDTTGLSPLQAAAAGGVMRDPGVQGQIDQIGQTVGGLAGDVTGIGRDVTGIGREVRDYAPELQGISRDIRGFGQNVADASGQVGRIGDDYWRNLADRGAYTQATLERDYPDMYQRAQDIGVQDIEAERVAGTRGIDYSDLYRNQYLQDVVDTSLADFDTAQDRAAAARRDRNAARGAFGSRGAMYDVLADSEAARQRGGLSAGLRYQAADRAFGLGQQDAGRGMQANLTNAANRLRADQLSRAAQQDAQRFNALQQTGRTQADVANAYQGRQAQANALRDWQANQLAAAGLQGQGAGVLAQGAGVLGQGANVLGQGAGVLGQGAGVFGQGAGMFGEQARLAALGQGLTNEQRQMLFQMGRSQFENPFRLLGLGQPLFGETGLEQEAIDETERGTTTRKGKGTSFSGSAGLKLG